MLSRICREQTDLNREEIRCLEEVSRQLPLMAELTGSDVFIDCITPDGRAVVAAQGRPSTAVSAYEKSVVGEYALPEREPAVFHAFRLQAPVRDIKAITQEDRTVRQDVAPIFGPDRRCIALLIRETDISGDLLQEKKYRRLAETYQEADPSLRAPQPPPSEAVALREVHHRVKNSLQLVASILNLQARRCGDGLAEKILRENAGRVLSIAAIHDILTKNREGQIDSLVLLEQLRKNLQSLARQGGGVTIRVTGQSAPLPPDTASSLALVINELTTNALEHAFPGRERGRVEISFCPGRLFHTVTVSDDGVGFDPAAPRSGSLGFQIVEATVRDKLRGHMTVHSGPEGTRISFDLKTE